MSPKWTLAETPVMPKGRYRIMSAYMPKAGDLGLDMMFRTCTVQVNLDFSSEADMVKKLRVGLALQPVATALFANSPFTEGKPNGFLSFRSEIWRDTDPDRTGMLPWVFEDGMSFERWTDYALDVPMYFVKRGDTYHDVAGQSFRDLMAGRVAALPGQRATIADWANHLTTTFPEVRLKRYPPKGCRFAARCPRCGPACSTISRRSMPPGISSRTGAPPSVSSCATMFRVSASRRRFAAARCGRSRARWFHSPGPGLPPAPASTVPAVTRGTSSCLWKC